MLRLPVRSYVAASDTVSEIVTVGGQRLRCGALAIAAEALGGSDQNQNQNQTQTQNDRRRKWVSRGVWVVDGPVFPAGCNQGMLIVPPGQGPPGTPDGCAVRVCQLGAATSVTPEGKFVLHASATVEGVGTSSAEDDLRGVLEMMVDVRSQPLDTESAPGDGESATGDGVIPGVEKPRLVWGAFYRQSFSAESAASGIRWRPRSAHKNRARVGASNFVPAPGRSITHSSNATAATLPIEIIVPSGIGYSD